MCNLRITLRYDDCEYVLTDPIPKINDFSTSEEKVAHQKHVKESNKISCIMATLMSLYLQKTFENLIIWDELAVG